MGIVIRQGIKSTIVSYLGVLIGTFNVLWLFPKYLLPEQIGLIRLLQDIPTLLAVFLQFGAANITEKFFFHFKDEKQKNNGFLFLLLIYPLLGFSLFTILFFCFQDFWIGIYQSKSPLILDYLIFILPLGFFMMYLSVLEAYCRVYFRIAIPALIREIIVRLLFSAITIFYAFKIIDLKDLVFLFTMVYGIALVILIGYIKKLGKLFLSPSLKFLNRELLSGIGRYVIYIIPGTAGSLIASKIDTLMIGAMLGLGYTGVYSLAYFIGTIVEIPKRALSQISIPVISQAWKDDNLDLIHIMYKKTSLNQLIVGSFLFLLVWANVDEILNLIPNSENYKAGKYVIFFIAFSKLIDMATGVNGEIILYSKYYRFNLISIVILAIITVITNLIFIRIYGIEGAAFAFALTIFIYNVLKSLFLWHKYKIHPFMPQTILVLIIAMVSYGMVYFINYSSSSLLASLILIAIKSLIIFCIFIGSILFFKVSEDISKIVHSITEKLK